MFVVHWYLLGFFMEWFYKKKFLDIFSSELSGRSDDGLASRDACFSLEESKTSVSFRAYGDFSYCLIARKMDGGIAIVNKTLETRWVLKGKWNYGEKYEDTGVAHGL